MGIDYVIDWNCVPKETFSSIEIVNRLKSRDRAATIQQLYHDHGDYRPPTEMGFEMVRRQPDGHEEVQTVVVQDLLNEIAELEPYAQYCQNCPANRATQPFGCFGYISYPISQQAELWLLKQLPTPDEPLPFLLLSQTMRDFNFNHQALAAMRASPGVFFESGERFAKNLEDTQITADQVFEMLFLQEQILPPHAALLLIFFRAIPRDMDADTLMSLTEPGDHDVPFMLQPEANDDDSTVAIKIFFEALYYAYRLGVPLSLDV